MEAEIKKSKRLQGPLPGVSKEVMKKHNYNHNYNHNEEAAILRKSSNKKSSEELFIEREMRTIDWDRMGHWEPAGKGGVWIDDSPGGGSKTSSILLGYIGIIFLIIDSYWGFILIFLAVVSYFWSNYKKRRYLIKRYKKIYGENQTK